MSQKITSAKTSINSTRVPALFKHPAIQWQAGTRNLDWGGGRYDTATEFLKGLGVENAIYDPYNREAAHNARVLAGSPYDSATVSNVLNVVQGKENRRNIIKDVLDNVKEGGIIYIKIYEGNGSGTGEETQQGSCWQENRKTSSYVDELKEFNPQMIGGSNKIIIIKKPITKKENNKNEREE